MNKKHRISVVGCGWLGLPLAESLIISGIEVKGSVTSPQKLEMLRNKGIDPYLVHFDGLHSPELSGLLECDVLIINIPPRSRSADGAAGYRQMAMLVIEQLPRSSVKKVILVSSTSVFSETHSILSENDKALPDTPAGQLLLEVENQFLAVKNIPVCVLRPAGLVGPERHPGRFFLNKSQIPNGLAPVNLIHRDDVIGIIESLVHTESARGIYHGCSLTHPTKQEFYGLAADSLSSGTPEFIPEKKSWKIISSVRIAEELGYRFKYPDLSEWLRQGPLKGVSS